MQVDKYFEKRELLTKTIAQYRKEGVIRKEAYASSLAAAHRDKAKHNLRFVDKNLADEEFNDWTIVALYYAVYHASLALIAQKGYISKNHSATILLLIKEYNISKDEANLIEELQITKEDAELYTRLKEKRQQASYSTNTMFSSEKVQEFRRATLAFIIKAETLLEQYS